MAPIVTIKYPLSVMYVEVNDTNFLNLGCYILDSSLAPPLFDIGIIFAANINYDKSRDRGVLHYNDKLAAVLDGHDTYIRPLQAKGIKVLLSILGNHQGVGICNFQDIDSAREFALELAQAVNTYGLDGIDFDDEYANYGSEAGSEQGSTSDGKGAGRPANSFSFIYLLRELRQLLPSKILSLYYYGPVTSRLCYNDLVAGDYLDYSWNAEYGKYEIPNVPKLTPAQLGPAAVDVQVTKIEDAESLAKKTIEEGYGIFLMYRLPNSDISKYLNSISNILYSTNVEVEQKCLQQWPLMKEDSSSDQPGQEIPTD